MSLPIQPHNQPAILVDSTGIQSEGVNKVAGYVWDPIGLAWIKGTQGGGGGGGGAATIADGADIAEGATADAAVVSDVAGTVSGKLRGLVKIFASVWDSANGRLKVDASAVTVPVSGIFYQATQPVSIATMPSTPVTGTFYQATQPVSIATMPSTPVTNANLDVALSTRLKPGDTLAALTSITNNVNTVEVPPTGVTHAKVPVTTAGTRVQLAAGACKAIVVKALSTNTGLIYIGGATVAASNGFQLAAGDSVSPDMGNSNAIYIDSAVNGEGVTWMAIN